MSKDFTWSTGRRKRSVARVRIKPGNGALIVNGRELPNFFHRQVHQLIIKQPLVETNTLGKYDIYATCNGGGQTGQAGALKHGISRALEKAQPELRAPLKKAGFLTRDPRKTERKKPGLKKARKASQFSKR